MKQPQYSEYKDSGVSWIGQVPSHWSIRRLKEIVKFSGGGTPARDNFAFWNGDIPWISPKDMKSELVDSSEESITAAGLAGSSASLVPAGTLLMVVRSGILKHTIPVGINTTPVALNQDMKALHPYGVRAEFLLRWIQGLNDRLLRAWAKQGATVESIEQDYLANTLIPFPSEVEQRTIVAFLDRETAKIDALIAEQERLLELLAEKRQAVISHAVTKGLNPDAPMKDSGVAWVGAVPAHWHLPPLSIRYESLLGKMLDSAKISGCSPVPYLRNIDVQWGRVNLEDLPLIDIDERDYERFTVRDGDLLVCEGGEVGRAALVSVGAARVGFQKALHRLRALSADEHPPYLFYTFNWAAKAGAFAGEGQATIAHLTGEQIRRYRFPTPPYLEQVEIAKYLSEVCSQFDTAAEQVRASLALLRERRSVLIANAVTGQIDVREAA